MSGITTRLETPVDYKETENLTREAFWDVYRPGCNEHLVLHKLRESSAFVKELDFVACEGNRIVGNIVYSKAMVTDENGKQSTVLSMGPICTLPSHQKRRIGSLLLTESIEKARSLGYNGIVIFGDPNFYHRFGFENASRYHMQTPEGENIEPFMALELHPGGLEGVSGHFSCDPAFFPADAELKVFDKDFPPKEKHVTDTQLSH